MAHAPFTGGESASGARRLALALVSCGLLMVQVALTKVFSIALWYHFGFLVISIALLGFATSGVWLSRRPEVLAEGGRLPARWSGFAALATVVSLWLVIHTEVDAQHLIRDRNEGALFFQIAILVVPFFFLGGVVSATLTLHRAEAGKVYSANLLGSGLGCAGAVAMFDGLHLSAPAVCLVSAMLMGIGGLLFAKGSGRRAVALPLVAVLLASRALIAEGSTQQFYLDAPASKPLDYVEKWEAENRPKRAFLKSGEELVFYGEPRELSGGRVAAKTPYGETVEVAFDDLVKNEDGSARIEDTTLIEFTQWSSLSRVDAFTWPASLPPWGLWGLSSNYKGEYPLQKGITIDTWAMTNVMQWDRSAGPPPEILEYLPASLVHRVKPEADILCIGAGGGMDLLTAKRFGAKRINGVEINPSIVKAVREQLLDFQGGLYAEDEAEGDPNGVTVHVAEGRHFLERDVDENGEPNKYDVVQLSGVDTASTTQAGAFSLSENFLYTIEAFDTYLEHTKDDGLVTLTRWVLPDQETGHPRNTLRLFVLAWTALERAGIEDPSKHVYLVDSNGFSVILFGRQPFDENQVARLDSTCEDLAFKPLYHPMRPSVLMMPDGITPMETNWYDAFAASEDKARFLADYPYEVAPPTDQRPFFFETSRFTHLMRKEAFLSPLGGLTAHAILLLLLVLSVVVAFAFVIRPLRQLGQELAAGAESKLRAPVLVYFACLGLGFILVEVVLSQRFILYLGNPLYSLAVVLFSVLIFSGIGSAWSTRFRGPTLPLLVVVALAVIYPLFLDAAFDATLMLPEAGRIALSVILLAPLSLAMGMPFPLGLSRLAEHDPRLAAWAWGINGYTSVVGSVLTVILSILFGFDVVVWIGAGVYAIAILAAAGRVGASRPEPIREETVSSDPLPGEPGSGEEPVLQPV
ncbi:MAG: hypothetical protein ACYS26_16025 [Planctomycetota bacterium]|jgi:hypothetical protein